MATVAIDDALKELRWEKPQTVGSPLISGTTDYGDLDFADRVDIYRDRDLPDAVFMSLCGLSAWWAFVSRHKEERREIRQDASTWSHVLSLAAIKIAAKRWPNEPDIEKMVRKRIGEEYRENYMIRENLNNGVDPLSQENMVESVRQLFTKK